MPQPPGQAGRGARPSQARPAGPAGAGAGERDLPRPAIYLGPSEKGLLPADSKARPGRRPQEKQSELSEGAARGAGRTRVWVRSRRTQAQGRFRWSERTPGREWGPHKRSRSPTRGRGPQEGMMTPETEWGPPRERDPRRGVGMTGGWGLRGTVPRSRQKSPPRRQAGPGLPWKPRFPQPVSSGLPGPASLA